MKWMAVAIIGVSIAAVGQTKTSQTFAMNNFTPTEVSSALSIFDDGPVPYDERKWAVQIIDGFFKRNPGKDGEYLFIYRSIPTGAYVKIDRAGKVKRHGVSQQEAILMLVAMLIEDQQR